MLCEKCHQKQATVHMQQIVNGTKTEMHLCQECSSHIDSPITIETLFNGLLGSILTMAAEKHGCIRADIYYEPCPACGMTYEDFKSCGGKLGCINCYRVFSRELDSIFKNVQASSRHEGKFPQKSGRSLFQKREAGRLRILMKKAVEEENFEEAARLRDEVKSLEAQAFAQVAEFLAEDSEECSLGESPAECLKWEPPELLPGNSEDSPTDPATDYLAGEL